MSNEDKIRELERARDKQVKPRIKEAIEKKIDRLKHDKTVYK